MTPHFQALKALFTILCARNETERYNRGAHLKLRTLIQLYAIALINTDI